MSARRERVERRAGDVRNLVRLRTASAGFALDFDAAWDPPVAALFGPSGSGKSTILEIIAGVRGGAEGRVVLGGETILDTGGGLAPPPAARRVGWVPQDASLFPHMSAWANVRYGLHRGGTEGLERLEAAVEVLEIGPLRNRRAHELSGGETQRVAVARAVASGARVLLMDEPLASLDAPLRARVFPLFVRLRDELRLPMLYVSHEPSEVLSIAPHVLVIESGRCTASGPSADVLGTAPTAGTFELHTAENRFKVRLLETHPSEGTVLVSLPSGVRLVMWAAPLPARAEFEVAIRGEEILLAAGAPGRLSAQNVLRGTVAGIRTLEGHAWVTVRVQGEPFVARITRRALEDLALAPGSEASVVFKAGSVRAVTRTDSG